MKKITSLFIVFILLFNISGYYILFSLMQHNIQSDVRNQIINGLQDKDLTLFVVPQNDKSGITWEEPEKEFSYKGAMYDVVRIKTIHQTKYYYCINDVKEQQLISQFKKSHSKKETEKRLKTNFNIQYLAQVFSLIHNNTATDYIFETIVLLYKSNCLDIHSPPPRLA
ncbi:MAG: hypothetical protein WCH34_05990 [Bacteroidota bacterium]